MRGIQEAGLSGWIQYFEMRKVQPYFGVTVNLLRNPMNVASNKILVEVNSHLLPMSAQFELLSTLT